MSESVLYEVEMATIDWQTSTQDNQQVTATTVDQAANWLMQLYDKAQTALDNEMKSEPPSSASNYSTKVNIWETTYNKMSQEWQNLENQWNTPIQSLDTHEQSLGNSAQEASQIAGTVIQPNKTVATLLQSQL